MMRFLDAFQHNRPAWVDRTIAALIVVIAVGLIGCLIYPFYVILSLGDYRYHPFLESVAPDQRTKVQIREKCAPPDCAIDIRLETTAGGQTLSEASDCWPLFAHVVWTANSSIAAIYWRDAYCGEHWIAYDVTHSKFVRFDYDLLSLLERSIREAYGAQAESTPDWIRSDKAGEEFRRLYYRRK
jgi:hypothetical protein